MPKIIAAPVNFVLTQIIAKPINLVNSIPTIISNIAQKFVEISDKLTAIYGEIKAAVSKTISDIWNKTKKKIKSLFFVFGTDENENEEKKIDEAKKAFHLKTFIHNLAQKLKHKEGKITDEY
jgi:predicted CopG family antitoxin